MKLFATIFILLISGYIGVIARTSPSEGSNMLADRHMQEQGVSCADCHNEDDPESSPELEMCLGCHGSWDDLAERTADEEINPHESHMGPGPCNECHASHVKSALICDQCHSYGMETP